MPITIDPKNQKKKPLDSSDATNDRNLKERLELKKQQLQSEHQELDRVIEQLSETNSGNSMQLQRMKKRKLALKDEISRINAILLPDIIA